jgi:hypothetical protein
MTDPVTLGELKDKNTEVLFKELKEWIEVLSNCERDTLIIAGFLVLLISGWYITTNYYGWGLFAMGFVGIVVYKSLMPAS